MRFSYPTTDKSNHWRRASHPIYRNRRRRKRLAYCSLIWKWYRGARARLDRVPGGASGPTVEEWKIHQEELSAEYAVIDTIVAAFDTWCRLPCKQGWCIHDASIYVDKTSSCWRWRVRRRWDRALSSLERFQGPTCYGCFTWIDVTTGVLPSRWCGCCFELLRRCGWMWSTCWHTWVLRVHSAAHSFMDTHAFICDLPSII